MRTRIQLTKDELRILAACLDHAKYDLNDQIKDFARRNGVSDPFQKFEDLQERLEGMAKDKRRQGRTSMNDWDDLLKRFIKTTKKQ